MAASAESMARRETGTESAPEATAPSPMPRVRNWPAAQWAAAGLAAAVLLGLVWATPRYTGDFYVALAGGRDVAATRLACLWRPDTWAFTTPGRVWINQNWGTHVLYYAVWSAAGPAGILALKALLLALLAGGVALSCRQRGVSGPVALLAAGAAVAAGRSYIDLRLILVTFTFAPLMLWLLYLTRRNPHRAWLATALLVVWANMHGAFIFGLGMMALWAICQLAAHAIGDGVGRAVRRFWPLAAAVVAAALLAGVLTPFGWRNLWQYCLIAAKPEWQAARDWRPIDAPAYGTTWELYVAVGMLVGLSVLVCAVHLVARRRWQLPLRFEQLALLVLAIALSAGLLLVAVLWRPLDEFRTHRHVDLWG